MKMTTETAEALPEHRVSLDIRDIFLYATSNPVEIGFRLIDRETGRQWLWHTSAGELREIFDQTISPSPVKAGAEVKEPGSENP